MADFASLASQRHRERIPEETSPKDPLDPILVGIIAARCVLVSKLTFSESEWSLMGFTALSYFEWDN